MFFAVYTVKSTVKAYTVKNAVAAYTVKSVVAAYTVKSTAAVNTLKSTSRLIKIALKIPISQKDYFPLFILVKWGVHNLELISS